MIQYAAIILITLVIFIYWYITRTFTYWKDRNVVGPEPVALFGNLKESALRRKNMGLVFEEIYKQFPKEKVVGVYRMTTPCLLIRDLDIIKHVMIKDFDLFADRGIEFSKEGFGANLFHADGELWRALRNQFTPIFTTAKLKNMLYLMTERGDKFVNYVDSIIINSQEQEIRELVQRYTIATIAACAFGLDFDEMVDKLPVLKKIDRLTLTPNIAHELDMMFPGILKKFNSSIIPAFVTDFFTSLVRQILAQRNNQPSNRHDFMDLLIELRNKGQVQKRNNEGNIQTIELSENIIAAQAGVFYFGGYETSATTMTFLLYQLALNPDIQAKLLEEIDEVIAKHNGQMTYECLTDMIYLDKVFKETLRMYSIADPLLRNAVADYQIPGTDVVIKKGQTVLVSPRGIHNDPDIYPDPEKFDPERFSVENSANRHPCAYLPFGVGPRHCIGMRFAQTQSRVCMAKLLSKFRVEPSKKTPRKMRFEPNRVMVGPAGGVYMNIIKRK